MPDTSKVERKLPIYPADHKVGMEVPQGGSDCAKCEYWEKVRPKECGEKRYIEWNGSGQITAPPDRFCCDFFEAKTLKRGLARHFGALSHKEH